MNSIAHKIREVNQEGERAFIPYVMAGDPTPEKSLEYVQALAEGGADLIELGVPFSDPVADGPTIQAAGVRALSSMERLEKVLELVKTINQKVEVPIILMSYYNPVLQVGEVEFISKSLRAGVNGSILPDLPVGEGEAFLRRAKDSSFATPLLATPSTDKDRLTTIAEKSTGFLYLVARPGTTGAKNEVREITTRTINFVKPNLPKDLPVCVGFGLSTSDQVAKVVNAGANGAIVGSAIVEKIGKGQKPEEIRKFVSELKEATKV